MRVGAWVFGDVAEECEDEEVGALVDEMDDEVWLWGLYELVEEVFSLLFGLGEEGGYMLVGGEADVVGVLFPGGEREVVIVGHIIINKAQISASLGREIPLN